MKPAPFRYHDPTTRAEALALLGRLENARLLAGGQSLVPMLNMRFATPDHLIDLNGVGELAGVRVAGGAIEIGAMTRQREIEFSPLVGGECPLLSEALRFVGHRQTRNRGTVGGSLSHLDPAAEIPCVCSALDAQIQIEGPQGARQIGFADFPAGYMTPAIEPSEMVTAVFLPRREPRTGFAFVEFARRHGDFALVSAAVQVQLDPAGVVTRCALALGGVDAAPVRMGAAESLLLGTTATSQLIAEAAEACRGVEPMDDPYAPAAYRKHLAGVLSRRALSRAVERARESAEMR